jgi:hypothetical protein
MRLYALTLLVFASLLSPSKASVLFDKLSYDGSYDFLDDASAGNWYTNSGNLKTSGSLVSGDVVLGVMKFNGGNISGSGAFDIYGANADYGGKFLYGLYAMELDDTSNNKEVTLIAATGVNSLSNILGSSGFTNWNRGDVVTEDTGFNAAFVLVESDVELTFDGSVKFNMFDNSNVTVIGTAGFDGIDDTYYISSTTDNVLDLDNFDNQYTVNGTATFLTSAMTTQGSPYFEDVQGWGLAAGTYGDMRLTGTIQPSQSIGTNYLFGDNVDLYINVATPEPSTIAIWSMIGLGGCGWVARRRRHLAKRIK